MVGIVLVILAGFSINSYNTGGVASLDEAKTDIVGGIKEGYSHDEFRSFDLND